jgi:glucose/arabinose dehydrogenase/mono/diheme cytochrome c family protein
MGNFISTKRMIFRCIRIAAFLFFGMGSLIRLEAQNRSRVSQDKYDVNASQIALGKELFEQNCASCHNFLQKGIGPSLGHITSDTTKVWITEFVKNPQMFIKKKDNRSLKLLKEYNQVMPAYGWLGSQKIEAVLAYLHAERKQKNGKRALDPAGLSDPIVEKIKPSGLTLKLSYVATAPPTSEKIPLARVNTMVTGPQAESPLFLSDLRGIIYQLKERSLIPYFELARFNSDFIHAPGLATGLGSFAFHPQFLENGLFYTAHTEKAGTKPADFYFADSIKVALQWVLTEWKTDDPLAEKFDGVPRELLRINMLAQIHGMQEVAFNPNAKPGEEEYGLLYVGIGDGGLSENGFPDICASRKSLWSSVIRIDPTGRNSPNGKYGIPSPNPFVGNSNAAGEVFSKGFRNPNRITWTSDNKMLVSDIGHRNIEELNWVEAGAHYGWPWREGTFRINPRANMDQVFDLPANDTSFIRPVLQYDHDEGNAISAGFVYEGNDIPLLKNKYIFGDIVNGRVFLAAYRDFESRKPASISELELELDGKIINFKALCGHTKTDLRFGKGKQGEMFLFTKTDGKIYKVEACY